MEARYVDSHDFKETELSNLNKDQDFEFGGSENEDIMEKFQQHTGVLPINQERLGTCLEDGKGLSIFETNFVILIRQCLVSLTKVSTPLESVQLEECHPIIQYGVSSELHQRCHFAWHVTSSTSEY